MHHITVSRLSCRRLYPLLLAFVGIWALFVPESSGNLHLSDAGYRTPARYRVSIVSRCSTNLDRLLETSTCFV